MHTKPIARRQLLTKPPEWGFWCECWTEDLAGQCGPALLAAFDACSAAQADRWVGVALRTISPALDSYASDDAWELLYESRIETRRALLRTEPCSVSVTHAGTRITWTIRPVRFLPLARHQNAEPRPCVPGFSTRPTE
ncbi:hypothetical protein QR97_15965 [Streptomyces sp. PBH53]|nr:hypothetical protein [Streptomyces sp. PBH53]AKN75362.1 hypothetical protein QR97_15965 [Streptomyces sp. PBH53]